MFTAAQQRGTQLSQTTEDAQKALQEMVDGLRYTQRVRGVYMSNDQNLGCLFVYRGLYYLNSYRSF